MKKSVALCAAVFSAAFLFASGPDVVIDTTAFRLTIGSDAAAKSLVVKATGEECLDAKESTPLFEALQERPFNNETKLAHPNKRTVYKANRLRREGDKLIAGFAVAPYEVVVKVSEADGYAVFEFEKFITNTTDERQYYCLTMDVPPVVRFRVVQLPVKNRKNFGEWLNVSWDERAAVAVIAAEPLADADHEDRPGFREMFVDLEKGRDLTGGKAAIVAGAGERAFLDAMEKCELGLGLPNGVASRRSDKLNASMYWTMDITPQNVDEQIAFAKRGGFRMMLIYFPALVNWEGYAYLGDYDWGKDYPNGEKDLKAVLDKIKAAGITPGFHTLQTHIGMKSRYVTPVADPRLNLKRRFTLAKALPAEGEVAEIAVLENPVDAVMYADARVLKFGGELFHYGAYTTEPPYRFTGVKRGDFATRPHAHPCGEIGGQLDITEYGCDSCYIDQTTDLQDEVAGKISKIYDQGMEFCYFDGSEGVNPPCGVYVPYSQYRTVKKFKKPPLFTEGAAKGHFGWHLQAGANAFDAFIPEIFKQKIAEYPLAEAPVMRKDFTRIDFGWWYMMPAGLDLRYHKPTVGVQPDMWEYGTSKAASWDCPVTVMFDLARMKTHARLDDLLDVMRRWEDVRKRKWLTPAQKEMLRDPKKEFHLLPDGKDGYELVEWRQLDVAGGKSMPVRAFLCERGGKRVVVYWHISGKGAFTLPGGERLVAEGMKEYVTDLPAEEVEKTFAAAVIGDGDTVKLEDWEFSRDRKEWSVVKVPHDWAIGEKFDITIDDQEVQVIEDGETKAHRRAGRTGALPWIGEGWYRRTVEIPAGTKVAELWFDGVMANSEVFADGTKIGERKNGYAPFTVKLPAGKRQTGILVHIKNEPQSSRWYPGAGIIRPVTLRLDPKYRVEDVFVRTEKLENGKAYMRVTGPGGERTFTVGNPHFWTPEDPYLYTLEPEGIRYGIRTVEWKDGSFRLNGVKRKFKGVCLHNDLGPVGGAFNPAAFRRQVKLLKEIGCDSIRTSHNIPSSGQMDICDEMGMMVMAESFDEWAEQKILNGYHLHFAEWWRKDLEALIRFHRNHPSIVMWSIGNEITDQRTPEGTRITREMIGLIRKFDPTRPVTQGHSWMPDAIKAGGVREMDIPGVTYRLPFYGALHQASMYGGVLGAETASTMSTRGWYAFPDEPAVDKTHASMQSSSYDLECGSWSNLPDDDWAVQDGNHWTLGEFVWTGFDYLGEPAPYDDARSRSSYFGIYDLAGLPKDRAYIYRSRWRTDSPTLHVLPHWTWPDRIGQTVPVYVYTSYPSAELFVNGKSQGKRVFDKSSRLDRYRLRWRNVVYEPGELKVVAYDQDGKSAATETVRTAGKPHHLVATPDRTRLEGEGDLAFVTVDVVDEKGTLCPVADNRISFKVSGAGRYKAACNGDPTDFDALSSPDMKAFNGRLVAVVEACAAKGGIRFEAESGGLGKASVELTNR